ncbi:MAG: endonuclease/exonuclease/phosphatase [Nitrospirae bacterium]|nr:MAG: endonuclease/exonuclease/phosphatase [Nitrospirota bacterium]
MPDIRVAWWNLENLFDHERAARDPGLARFLKSELKGWTAAVRDRKLDQLASIIGLMFDEAGPDLLGVAEAENEAVLELLAARIAKPGREYRVLGHESLDARGIDVSFIYDASVLAASHPAHQVVVKRTATRDLFWATFTVRETGASFVAMANHWPARSAGQYLSEPFRMLTGETVSVVLANLLDTDKYAPVLLMGDFNDEPFNRSMQEYLLGTRDREQVTRARSPRVWNLMWPLMDDRHPGTYRHDSVWNMLDQFLVTKGMLRRKSRVKVVSDSASIFRPPPLLGRAKAPRRFGRPSRHSMDRDGYSDHFPITLLLRST